MDSYEEALLDVGTVLSRYDEDNNYAVYGFGGEPIRRFYANHPSSSDDKSPLPSLSRMTSVVAQVQSESKEAEAPASTTPTDKVKETMQAATEVLEAVEAAEAEEAKAAVVETPVEGAAEAAVEGAVEGAAVNTPVAENALAASSEATEQKTEETTVAAPTESVEHPKEPENGSDMATISAADSSDSESQYASAESSTEEEEEAKEAKAVDEGVKVVDESVTPIEEVAKPVEEVAKPVEEVAKPVEEVAKPIEEVAKPVEEVAKPIEEVAKPVEEVAKPVEEVAKPIEETVKPANDTTKPSEDTAVSTPEPPKPVENNTKPISLQEDPNPTDSAKESPSSETPVEVKEKKALEATLNAQLAYLKGQSSFSNSTRDFESKELSLELFPLNGNQNNPYIHGVNGVLKAYRSMVKNLLPSYPTYFQHILKEGIRRAKKAEETHGKEYVVLILISDCCIVDQVETLRLVVEASRLPMSLIILGMGDNDFHFMDVLDGDDEMPSLDGQTPARDVAVSGSALCVDGAICEIRGAAKQVL